MAGCGYGTAIQYKLNASSNYELRITTDDPSKASAAIKQSFKDEGMEPTFYTDHGTVESYAFFESGSNATITLYHDEGYKIAVVAIYPARLNSVPSNRRTHLKEREALILRIKSKLIKTDSFDEQ